MGFIKRITGQDAQLKAARANAKAVTDAAAAQTEANNATAAANAQAASDAVVQAQARQDAQQAAQDALATPVETVDVQVDPSTTDLALRRKRRAQFGSGTTPMNVSL